MGGWRFFLCDGFDPTVREDGKWMFFYGTNGLDFAEKMCAKAISEGVVREAKRWDINAYTRTGVACFYLKADDTEGHKRVLRFFLENGLIRKTKKGRLCNISFKLDEQTWAGEYGSDFVPTIRLEDFVDLDTGEFRE